MVGYFLLYILMFIFVGAAAMGWQQPGMAPM